MALKYLFQFPAIRSKMLRKMVHMYSRFSVCEGLLFRLLKILEYFQIFKLYNAFFSGKETMPI